MVKMGTHECTLSVQFIMGLICLSSLLQVHTEASEASEAASNSINVTFYNMPMKKWTDERENKFKSILVDEANEYCEEHADKCGLIDEWHVNGRLYRFRYPRTFSPSDLVIMDKESQTEKKALKALWYLKFPDGLTNDSKTTDLFYVLPYAALDAIATEVREELSEEIGYYVIGVGNGVYHPPPNHQLNWIIISIVLVVLLILTIVAIVLNIWKKRKTQKIRFEKKMRKGKEPRTSGKVSPVMMETGKEKVENGGSKPTEHRRIEDDYGSQDFSASLATRETHIPYTAEDPYAATDQILEIPDVSQRGGGIQLPPLDTSNHVSEEQHRHQKKRSKKEKKKKRRHNRDDSKDRATQGYENPNYDDKRGQEMNIPVAKTNHSGTHGTRQRRRHSGSDNEDGSDMVTEL